jgi:SAM-dependent methyltransferase
LEQILASMDKKWTEFIAAFQTAVQEQNFVKLTLSAYRGETDLKNIYIKPILIKEALKLSFTYRHKTRDIVKNYNLEEALALLENLFGPAQFSIATLMSTETELVCSIHKSGRVLLKRTANNTSTQVNLSHDKQKQRKIAPANKSYLQALHITNSEGTVLKAAQDKYKQINHYIEILSPQLKNINSKNVFHVADMGSGKGYLTFALYDYLKNSLNIPAKVTGVEYRADMVELCNQIALQSEFEDLNFVQDSIQNYKTAHLDMIIALHACDTATDDAIFKGLAHDAQLIVVAPCCHKQIRRSMTKGSPSKDMDFLLNYGLFFERQAEMITDSIRALILEHYGYTTKVVDFISDLHTPKNVLIIAEKKKQFAGVDKHALQTALQNIKSFWGIDQHYLEKLLQL